MEENINVLWSKWRSNKIYEKAPKAHSISWAIVDIQSAIKINILRVASGETSAYVIKLLSMLGAVKKEGGREVFRLAISAFPFSYTAGDGLIDVAKMPAAHPNVMSSILSRS